MERRLNYQKQPLARLELTRQGSLGQNATLYGQQAEARTALGVFCRVQHRPQMNATPGEPSMQRASSPNG